MPFDEEVIRTQNEHKIKECKCHEEYSLPKTIYFDLREHKK